MLLRMDSLVLLEILRTLERLGADLVKQRRKRKGGQVSLDVFFF